MPVCVCGMPHAIKAVDLVRICEPVKSRRHAHIFTLHRTPATFSPVNAFVRRSEKVFRDSPPRRHGSHRRRHRRRSESKSCPRRP